MNEQCPACAGSGETHSPSGHQPMAGRPVVVAVHPRLPVRVLHVAAELAESLGSSLMAAYVDESRVTVERYDDGSVRHTPLMPEDERTPWEVRNARLRAGIEAVMAHHPGVEWQFRYRAGLADKELAHLAHVIGAGSFVLGTRAPGFRWQAKEWFDGSVALNLSRRQLRPVVIVPLASDDWDHPLRDELPEPRDDDAVAG